MPRTVAEIRDPIHGYIHITEAERAIIDTPLFQRLRRIRQLAGAHLTYPGAQHSRFEHLLGAMHLAGLVAQHLQDIVGLSEEEAAELRLAALLHDVGHGPFSHLYEEVMTEKTGQTHEDLTRRILRETYLNTILADRGFDAEVLADLAIGRAHRRPPYLNEVIGGSLSVDIMDYLLRDSYFTGVEYGRVDVHRLITSFLVVEDHLALDRAALYAYEALAIARYAMFRAVYFHRTVRAAEIMLMKALELADAELHYSDTSDLDRYLSLTDEAVLEELTHLPTDREELRRARRLAEDYRDRRLLKCVFELTVHRRSRLLERLFSQPRVRREIEGEIAEEAKVDEADVFLDVSTTPSVPHTYERERLTTLTLVTRGAEGDVVERVGIEQLPLLSSLTGYMDIIRVYTTREHRGRVAKAVEAFFGREGYATQVSM
jgi:hypothetical protein